MTQQKELYAPAGANCRPGLALLPRYITIHNTANTSKGAGAQSHAAYLRGVGKDKYVSWHYAVDDKLITHCIPDGEVAWHAGDGGNGTGNRQSLAIEICENPESNLMLATDNAAELAAALMKQYGVPFGNVVQHNHWSGKDCPRRIRRGEPYDWATFLAKVQGFFAAQAKPETAPQPQAEGVLWAVQTGAYRVRKNAQAALAAMKAKGYEAYITESGGLLRVQLGAFAVRQNAYRYAKTLNEQGIEAFVTQKGN